MSWHSYVSDLLVSDVNKGKIDKIKVLKVKQIKEVRKIKNTIKLLAKSFIEIVKSVAIIRHVV